MVNSTKQSLFRDTLARAYDFMTTDIYDILSGHGKEKMSQSEFESRYSDDPNKIPDPESIGYVERKLNLIQRGWFKNTARAAFLATTLPILAISGLRNYSENHLENLANQQSQQIESFCNSSEFREFQDDFKSSLAITLDYISNQPDKAATVIPAVANVEKETGKPSWTYHVYPEINSDQDMLYQTRRIASLLNQRGYTFENNIDRLPIVNALNRCMNLYLNNNPDKSLPLIIVKGETLGERILSKMADSCNPHMPGSSIPPATRADIIRMSNLLENFERPALRYNADKRKSIQFPKI